ncbi:MAG: helix-turn-helix domain-containing protein [Bacteroidales bacterium]|jgi:YesN/AraC family two-component response regulator|nr:helix-turn-helix domain-containing protein [Bacteroidales bacterium]MBQ4298743.1 helix-turn-helix domain-containing protein [Bacteroidales bacterium]
MTEKKPFLVCSFTLGDLASALYSNKVYLSKTINHFSGRNFRQYVNYYRVMYSMELFRNNMTLKVSDLSNLSGFHSSTTFTQAFQNVMGKTPSAWCWEMRRSGRTGKK